MYYELTPAYGRDYKKKDEVIAAFKDGKDVEGDYQLGFQLCSISDIPKGSTVNLRYKRNTAVVVFKVV